MNRLTLFVLFSSALLHVSPTAMAHHNTSTVFDTDVEFVIEGVVDKLDWKNPHVYFAVTGTDDTGAENTWRIEAGPTAIMRRLGWSKDSLVAGDTVTVTANPSRNPNRASGYLVDVTSPGKTLPAVRGETARDELAKSSAEAVGLASDISGTWVTLLNLELFQKMNDQESLPLTEKGAAAMADFDEATMGPALECIPYTAPSVMFTPDIKSIKISDDTIRIRGEFDNAERIVHLGSKAVAGDATVQGFSSGRWQDGVLLVDTDNFSNHRSGNAFGLPSGAGKILHEELELSAGGKSLTYRFALEDPEFLTEPLSGEAQWAYRPDLEYESLECDLENSRLFLKD